jgi:hypothetical protein
MFLEKIRKWIYTDKHGIVQEMDESLYSLGLVWDRFSKVNNLNSFSKASFLNNCPPSFNKDAVSLKPGEKTDAYSEKYFGQIILTNGAVQLIKINEFKLIIYQLFANESNKVSEEENKKKKRKGEEIYISKGKRNTVEGRLKQKSKSQTRSKNQMFSMLGILHAIQAYRDTKSPVIQHREIYLHIIQYKDEKYYSLIKNGSNLILSYLF